MGYTTSLISMWEFEEATGTRVDAVTASGNDLTDSNGVTRATGKVGFAAQFTASSSQSLIHADNAGLSVGNFDWSLLVWAYADSFNEYDIILSKYNSDGGPRAYYLQRDPAPRFSFGVYASDGNGLGEVVSNFGSPLAATWYMIAVGYDMANNLTWMSVNAAAATTHAANSGRVPFDEASSFRVGHLVGDGIQYWNGRIDQAGFWKKDIREDLTWWYNGGAGRTYAAAVAADTPPAAGRSRARGNRRSLVNLLDIA